MKAATRESRKTLPDPVEREHFTLPLVVSAGAVERMRLGHIPEEMEDRWFIHFESGWLYFHRSWTGACIFGVGIVDAVSRPEAAVECWVSRDKGQYTSSNVEHDKEILTKLISRYFRA